MSDQIFPTPASGQTYTLAEAAARIGMREDSLVALLPEIGVDLDSRSPQILTEDEYAKLADAVERLKTLHREGIN